MSEDSYVDLEGLISLSESMWTHREYNHPILANSLKVLQMRNAILKRFPDGNQHFGQQVVVAVQIILIDLNLYKSRGIQIRSQTVTFNQHYRPTGFVVVAG